MFEDPIIDELHRIRREHAAKFGYDIHKIVEDIEKNTPTTGHPIVRREPKRIKAVPVSKASKKPA